MLTNLSKSEKEISAMKEGGKKLAAIMKELGKHVKPGVSTWELDELAQTLISDMDGKPAFKGYGEDVYNQYPATICTSLNDEVVHGIPSKKVILKSGDLLKIDLGMEYRGMFTDMARTFVVGKIDEESKRLMKVTEECFWKGVEKIKAGAKMSDYSKAVQKHAEENGFSVVRNLVGHGVGWELHEDPQIPNFHTRRYDEFFWEEGMTVALEPMINEGMFETILGEDGWVFCTKDGRLSAHYENTVLVKKDGCEVLTV